MDLKKIREIRKMRCIKQKELAKTVGISAVSLSNIERGKASPTLCTIKKIADALNFRIEIIL